MSVNINQEKVSDVLIFGQGRSSSSIAACLSIRGTSVSLVTDNPSLDTIRIEQHLEDYGKITGISPTGSVKVLDTPIHGYIPSMAIITGYSDVAVIHSFIQLLEEAGTHDLFIAIATDHISLSDLQAKTKRPENIVVMNWAEPAHTTFFLEIVYNETTDPKMVTILEKMGKDHWEKDPYTVQGDLGIRGRMNTAMLREAMFLVDKGYANVEDIDRACRNDAGTYMPFAGNFQYMDLMGTYAYGVVMEKLNKELSNATEVPPFVDKVFSSSQKGKPEVKEFYSNSEEKEEWESRMRSFSFEIQELIRKYPSSK